MTKLVMRAGLLAQVCALCLTGSGNANAGIDHAPLVAPGPTLLNTIGPGGSNICVDKNIMGGLQLSQSTSGGSCPYSVGGQSGWSPWRGGDVGLVWSPNPSSGTSAWWTATVPADSEFRARVALLDGNGDVVSIGAFVYGGGLKTGSVAVGGGGSGIMILNFQMRGYRAGTSGLVPSPVLQNVAGVQYIN